MSAPSFPGSSSAARWIAALAETAARASSLREYRAEVLALVRDEVRFDAAIFHALSPRVPLETGVVVGLPSRSACVAW